MDRLDALRRAIVQDREARGWSQERLASEAGMARPTLSDIETGITSDPRRETIERIARALQWSRGRLEELLSGAAALLDDASDDPLADARRRLPAAPRDILRRYQRLTVEIELASDELSELVARYGEPAGQPSTPQRDGET